MPSCNFVSIIADLARPQMAGRQRAGHEGLSGSGYLDYPYSPYTCRWLLGEVLSSVETYARIVYEGLSIIPRDNGHFSAIHRLQSAMPLVQLLTYPTDQGLSTEDRESIVKKATKGIESTSAARHVLVSTQVPDEHDVQVALELSEADRQAGSDALIQCLRPSLQEPKASMIAEVSTSPFAVGGAATSTVIEWVQVWFPSSRLTPEFRAGIESDFARFETIFFRGSDGDEGGTSGWSSDDEDHPEIAGEKARCFFVMRGWRSMEHFERSVQTDAAKEAHPIVYGWNAPFKLVRHSWSICRPSGSD